MHLLCLSPECIGSDLPAGDVDAERCRFCGQALTSPEGNVLATGTPDELGLTDHTGSIEVGAVQLEVEAVRHHGKVLVASQVDGELVDVQVLEGEDGERVARLFGDA